MGGLYPPWVSITALASLEAARPTLGRYRPPLETLLPEQKKTSSVKSVSHVGKSHFVAFFAGRQQPQIIGSSGSCYAPPNSIRSQKGYDEIILTGAGGGTSSSKISSSGGGPPIAKKSIMKKPPVPLPSNQTVLPVAPPVVNQSECQYAQLIFDKNHRHFSADDSVLYLNTNSSR